MLSQVIIHRTTGPLLSPPMDTPLAMVAVVSAVLSLDILVLGMDMDTALEVSAEGWVSTLLDQFMNPDLPRVLVREVLMLSQVITHRTTGLLLSPPMDTPLAMVAVVSAVLSQDILVLAMGMDTALEVSAEGLVSTLLDLFMSQDLPRVLVRAVLMLSQVITHKTTGPQLSPPMDTPLAMVAVVSAVLSLDISVLGMDMDTALEVSAEVLVSTQLDLFMSQDLPKDLASAVLSLAILVMVLPPMAMLLVV